MSTTPRIPPAIDRDPPDILQALVHAPGPLQAWLDASGLMWSTGAVDLPTMEVVRMRVARQSDCGY